MKGIHAMRHKLMGTGIFTTAAALVAAVGLAQPTGQKGASKEASAARPPAEQEKRRTQVVASFEGGTITVGDLEDTIGRQSPYMRGRYRTMENRRSLLSGLLRFELLAREAERRGFGDHTGVQDATKRSAVQALTKTEFDDGQPLDAIPNEKVKEYYEENIKQFVQAETRRAAQIVLATEQEAKTLMDQAREADLREFRRLAQEHSQDEKTALRGGDLRYFDEDGVGAGQKEPSVDPVVVKAAFALKEVGDVVKKPVQVEGGWSIVKLTGKRPAVSRSLKDAAPTIRRRLWRSDRTQALEDFIAQLREKYKPEVHPDLLQHIELEVAPPGKNLRPGFPTGRPPRSPSKR